VGERERGGVGERERWPRVEPWKRNLGPFSGPGLGLTQDATSRPCECDSGVGAVRCAIPLRPSWPRQMDRTSR
jgi:hypothetical protein